MMRRTFDETVAGAPPPVDHRLLCRAPGCGRRWTCDFGKPLCSEHDRTRHEGGGPQRQPLQLVRSQPLPFREAARSFAEPMERDDEEPEF